MLGGISFQGGFAPKNKKKKSKKNKKKRKPNFEIQSDKVNLLNFLGSFVFFSNQFTF